MRGHVGERLRITRKVEPAPPAIQDVDFKPDVAARETTYRRALLAGDLTAGALALLLATLLTGQSLHPLTFCALPVMVAGSKLLGLYDHDELVINKSTLDEAPQIFQLATLGALALGIVDDQLLMHALSDPQILLLWASLLIFTLGCRAVMRRAARRRVTPERCLFIGDTRSYGRLGSKFEAADVPAILVGRMNLQRAAPRGERDATELEIRHLIAWTQAQRIIIEPQALPPDEMLELVRAAKGVGVRVSLLPRVLDVVGSEVVFDNLQGMTLLGVRRFGLSRSSRLVKRGFDLVGAGLITMIVAPAMALIALMIKLDSRDSVFFRQTRVGRDGRQFQIMKFRTMGTDAEARKADLVSLNEAQGLFKIADDPRITRVGRLLRRTSLDELPQLFNVLRGDMSLVGPRPLVLDEDAQITGFDRRRLQLTPGMTLAEMVKIDYLYVAGWSLWDDVKILLRTVPYMLARRGQ
jgi:lipopolysaccharide/colanic/teichoic acid biosynthesis glycosyltransferase